MRGSKIKFLILFLSLYSTFIFPQHSADELLQLRDFTFVRDTVYTLKPYFIEVNLVSQKGYLHSKTGSVTEFRLSSGNNRLKDGVETKEGIYVIQSMMPKWYSRQFDSTVMLNWMGFNYGIGFHALRGKSYYRFLGKKKSSHGCLRLSKETAEDLFSKVDLGTPVLVHSNDNAVTIAFTDSSSGYKYYSSDKLIDKIKSRLTSMYKGRYYLDNREQLVIDFANVNHPGIPIGNKKLIPKLQVVRPVYIYISTVTPPACGVMKVEHPSYLANLSNKVK
jgi:hypothetical protein